MVKEKELSRPTVQCTIGRIKFPLLYDSGSELTILSSKCFRQIPIPLRPTKIKGHKVQPISASGTPLTIQGCYIMTLTILGRQIKHPVYVCNNIKLNGLIGYDFSSKHGLNLEASTGQVYFEDQKKARLSKEIYLPARCSTIATVHSELSGDQMLSLSIDECPQVMPNDLLIRTEQNSAQVNLVNVSDTPMKIPRGTPVGNVYKVEEDDLLPWDPDEELSVAHTTPFLDKKPAPRNVKLTPERRGRITQLARLDHLPPMIKVKYLSLLHSYHDTLSLDEFELSTCNQGAHCIPLRDENVAKYQPQFPLSYAHREEINRQVNMWYKLGLIRRCESEWNSPLFVVKKKALPGSNSIKYRVVMDLRQLNANTKESNVKIPLLSECLDQIGTKRPKFFSSFDLRSGFHQVELAKKDQHKTAFEVPGQGQYCWKVCAQGLAYMPASFTRIMNRCFKKLLDSKDILVYLDDLLAFATSHDEMLAILERILQTLRKVGLLLNIEKTILGASKLTYLGYEIDEFGYRPDPSKTVAIKNCSAPTTLKQIRCFLGMCQFYRNHFPRFSETIKPLSKLTGHKANWSGGTLPPDALAAFKKCKDMISTRPALCYPDLNLRMHLYCDGSLGELGDKNSGGLSATLVQYENDDITKPPRILGFANRTLADSEKNYSAFLIENAASVFGIEQFSKYLLGRRFTLWTDHKPMSNLNGSQKRTHERLREILATYSFDIAYIEGIKQPADYLSRFLRRDSPQIASISSSSSSSQLCQLNPSSLLRQQQDDPFIASLRHFVITKELPNDPTLRNIIKRFGPSCFLENNLVYRHLARQGQLGRNVLVAPGHLHAALLAEAHGSIYGGHKGEFKTAERLLESFWWPSLYSDTAQFVKSCSTCIRNAPRSKHSSTYLEPFEANEIFARIHIDLYGPLSTDDGKNFILVAVCSASKYAIFVPLENKTPEQVAQALFDHWFTKFGIPRILVSDSGTEFKNKLLKALCNELNIDQRFISVQMPRVNGQAEQQMKGLTKYLKAFTQERPLDWKSHLSALQWSYNTSVNKATKASPFSLLYGLDARSPINNLNFINRKFYGEDYQTSLMKRLQTARKIAFENNENYKMAYKKYFDKSVHSKTWNEGQLVWLHQPELCKVNPKLTSAFMGPYVILEIVNIHTVVIQHLATKKTKVVNVNRLRNYSVKTDDLKWNTNKVENLHTTKDAESHKVDSQGHGTHADVCKNASSHAGAQNNSASGGPQFIDFEGGPDVIILNPEAPPPLPKVIKTEPVLEETQSNPDQIDTLESENVEASGNFDTLQLTQDQQQHASFAKSLSPSKSKIAHNLSQTMQGIRKSFSPQKLPSASEMGETLNLPFKHFTRKVAKTHDVVVPEIPIPSRAPEYKPTRGRGGPKRHK